VKRKKGKGSKCPMLEGTRNKHCGAEAFVSHLKKGAKKVVRMRRGLRRVQVDVEVVWK
jgi:hypothetical protein